MDVLIVGAGAMGRWFADAIGASVAFADVDDDAARAAAERVDGRTVALDGTERFDAVCLAVPMSELGAAIEAQAPRAEEAILDVAGVMAPAIAAMEVHAPDVERVSLHPLFAPERAPGSIAVVADRPGPTTDRLLADLEAAGNEPFETTAADHDAAMESVQAAAHAAVLAFALAAEPVPREFETPVYERLRELVGTVTDGTPRVYADIQEEFDGARDVAATARRVADADRTAFGTLYREAGDRWLDPGDGDE